MAVTELNDVLSLLESSFRNHTLVQFDKVYYEQNYFVLKEEGEIIAGVQANPVCWQIVDMPGISGKVIMHLLPHIPVVKRLINPAQYQFAALEAIYVKPGRENEWLHLLESVLAHFGFTSALLMLDANCPINQKLKATGKLGVMNFLKKRIYSQVMVKLNGIGEKQAKQLCEQPIYVSAFDCT